MDAAVGQAALIQQSMLFASFMHTLSSKSASQGVPVHQTGSFCPLNMHMPFLICSHLSTLDDNKDMLPGCHTPVLLPGHVHTSTSCALQCQHQTPHQAVPCPIL